MQPETPCQVLDALDKALEKTNEGSVKIWIYFSRDKKAWSFVGTALEPVNAMHPFYLDVDPSLQGLTVYIMAVDQNQFPGIVYPAREWIVPKDGKLVITSIPAE